MRVQRDGLGTEGWMERDIDQLSIREQREREWRESEEGVSESDGCAYVYVFICTCKYAISGMLLTTIYIICILYCVTLL